MTEEEKIKDFLKFCAVGYSEDKGISFEGNPFYLAIKLIEKLEEESKNFQRAYLALFYACEDIMATKEIKDPATDLLELYLKRADKELNKED